MALTVSQHLFALRVKICFNQSMKPKPFKNKLHEYLRTSNLSQADFALAVGVTTSMVSLWINKKRVPSVDKLKKLIKITGLRMEDLV